MRCLYRAIARLAPLRPVFLRPAIQPYLRKTLRRPLATQAYHILENADMGKEKTQFQLKTPKGTKDCK